MAVGLGRHQEVDEEEADRREMAEIQGGIEARKTAKDLAVAHATLKGLRASTTEPIPTALARGSKQPERKTKPDSKTVRQSRRETKKIPVAPPEIEMPVVAKVARRVNKNIPKEKVSGEEGVSLRGSKRMTASRHESDPLETLKFSSIVEQSSVSHHAASDASNISLGMALVASALGRKVPETRISDGIASMSECHVALSTEYADANKSASIAPPNSVESDEAEQGEGNCDARLSQSDVYIGLPGYPAGVMKTAVTLVLAEIVSATGSDRGDEAALIASAVADVAANEEVSNEPVAQGVVAGSGYTSVISSYTPVLSLKVVESPEVRPTPGSVEEKAFMKLKYEGNKRRICEISATQLLQEELAKVDPCLVSISAFLGTVCGTDKGEVELRESVKSAICSGRPRAEEVLEQVMGASREEADKSGNVVAPMVDVGEIGAVTQVAVPAELGSTMGIIAESAVMADGSANVIASATESI